MFIAHPICFSDKSRILEYVYLCRINLIPFFILFVNIIIYQKAIQHTIINLFTLLIEILYFVFWYDGNEFDTKPANIYCEFPLTIKNVS